MSSDRGLAVVEAQPTGLPATMDNAPAVVLAEAQKAAAALKDVITRKPRPVLINNEQYLEFEDWQTVGRFYGVTVGSEGEPEHVEIEGAAGFKATAVALRNGQVISRATAYCMRDEERWAKAPTYQIASMAQTRANAKALRNVLSWVAVLAGYKPTPAEEMDGVRHDGQAPATQHGTVPACPKCKTPKKVIASKFLKGGVRPWYCNGCKSTWGNAEAGEQPPQDEPWEPEDETGARG